MQVTAKHIAIFSTVAGVALYYCEWLKLFAPGFSGYCIQSQELGFWIYFIIPLLFAGVIGYIGFKKPLMYWFLFMIPSGIVRFKLGLESASNLYPIGIGIDFIHPLLSTVIILGFVARFRRRQVSKKQ